MNERIIICCVVVFLSTGTVFGQLEDHRKSRSYGNQQSDSLSEIEDLLKQVNGDSISSTIQDLQNFGSRYEYAPGRKAAAEYIHHRFQKYGMETSFDPFESGVQFSVYTAASPDNSGKIWVTGYNGIIQCSEDSGKTWIIQKCLYQDNLTDMFFIDTLSGWCAGNYGDIYGTRNSGTTWEKLSNISWRLDTFD